MDEELKCPFITFW